MKMKQCEEVEYLELLITQGF